jgi:hypothetical protein
MIETGMVAPFDLAFVLETCATNGGRANAIRTDYGSHAGPRSFD